MKYCPLVVIVGPTASGKSELGLKLASSFNGAIVSADSWLVRRGLDIGTSKPTTYDRSKIDHYLIDIVDADQDFSAAAYKPLAIKAIETIKSKQQIPFLVGGSGLYIDSVLYDYGFSPLGELNIRDRLNEMSLTQLQEMATKQGLDLSQIDHRNKRRVIRLIETNGFIPTKHQLRENTLIIGLSVEAERLNSLITARTNRMIEKGLIQEVETLYRRYGWECEGLKGIGYQEWKLYFEANQSLDTTKDRIIKDSLALAKRQKTWFKRNKSIHWLNTPVNYAEAEDLITTFLNKNISLS